jgi:hypothetical protein
MIEGFVASEQKRATKAQERKDAADFLEETRSKGAMDVLSHPLDIATNFLTTGNASGKTEAESELDKDKTKDMASRMVSEMVDKNKDKFMALDLEDMMVRLGGARTPEEKIAIGREMGLSKEDFAIWERWMITGGDSAQNLTTAMAEVTTQMQADLAVAERLRPIREALLKQNKEALKAIRDRKRELETEQKIRMAVVKITAQGAKAFLNAASAIQLSTDIELGEAETGSRKKFGGIVSIAEKQLGEASTAEGFKGTQLESDIRRTLADALIGGAGTVSEAEVGVRTKDLDKLIETLKGRTASDDEKGQAEIAALTALKSELENVLGGSDRLSEELKDNTKKIKASSEANKRVAEQQRRLKSFGGPQALLDPGKLNTTFSKIASGGKAMAASQRAGSTTGFNRGRINQLETAKRRCREGYSGWHSANNRNQQSFGLGSDR